MAMMDKTIQALKNSQNVLLELPTGSGKSLSLLCAAAAWHEREVRELQEEAAMQKPCAFEAACNGGDGEEMAPDGKKKKEKPRCPPKIYIASRTHAQLAQLGAFLFLSL
jgi:Rad3-related DNA helicase